jgi:ATP-dependent RNA helicase DDX54/DBP10
MAIKAGLKSNYIYGAMDQFTREEKLREFRKKWVNFMFVTDLAARGIDIPFLENVVHYDFPTKMKLFIHRAGRTARAGRTGVSYGLVTNEELAYLHDLSIFVGRDHLDVCTPEQIADPQIMCFGRLPQHLLDEYCFYVQKLYDTHTTLLEPLKHSMKNSLSKYLKTRDPAAFASVQLMKSH